MALSPADAATALYNLESAPKTASVGPKAWSTLQPNSGGLTGFRAAIEFVARRILSKNLTPEAGSGVGLSVAPRLTCDVNKETLDTWSHGMYRCLPKHFGNKGQSRYQPTAVTATGYTVAALGDLTQNLLINAVGFTNAANNGLKIVSAASTGIETKAPGLVAEAAPPANAYFDVVGVVASVAADFQMSAGGDITCTAGNFLTAGFVGGMTIKVGGTIANSFFAVGGAGYAEVDPTRAITATFLPLRNHTFAFAGDVAAGKSVQLFVTKLFRNYPLTDANFSKATSQIELETPGIGTAGASSFRYFSGLRVGAFDLDAPLKNKITLSLSMIGLECLDPVLQAGRLADTATALAPLSTAMFDTTNDIKYIRLATAATNVELIADIENWKLSQNLNLKPQEIQGVKGAKSHIDGEMEPSLSIGAYLTTDDITKAVNDERDVSFCAILANATGGFAVRLPAGKLHGDEETRNAGEGVMVDITFAPHREPASGILSSLTVFGYLP